MLTTDRLPCLGGPLDGASHDLELIRVARAFGYQYVRAVDDGEACWRFVGLAPRGRIPGAGDAVVQRAPRPWRLRVADRR